jgi:hemerythrin
MTQQKIKWDDAYSLGIKNIDDQHKKLFDIVDKIFSLQESKDVKGNIRTILHELFEYIKVHFKDEEEFMKSINYPDLAYHIELHEQLVKSVSGILGDPSRLDIIQMKMRVIAKQALIDHILEEDMKYQRYYFSLKKSEIGTIDEPIINLDI